jgi:hypothetical protein
MELFTGLMLLSAIVKVGKAILSVEDEDGKTRSLEFKGRYNRRELDSYRNQKIDIEFELDNEGNMKNLKISHTPPTTHIR